MTVHSIPVVFDLRTDDSDLEAAKALSLALQGAHLHGALARSSSSPFGNVDLESWTMPNHPAADHSDDEGDRLVWVKTKAVPRRYRAEQLLAAAEAFDRMSVDGSLRSVSTLPEHGVTMERLARDKAGRLRYIAAIAGHRTDAELDAWFDAALMFASGEWHSELQNAKNLLTRETNVASETPLETAARFGQ